LDVAFMVPKETKKYIEEKSAGPTWRAPAWIEVTRRPLGGKKAQMYNQVSMIFSHHSWECEKAGGDWMQPLFGLEVRANGHWPWALSLYGYSYCGVRQESVNGGSEKAVYNCVGRCKIAEWPKDCLSKAEEEGKEGDCGQEGKERSEWETLRRILAFPVWYAMRYNKLKKQAQEVGSEADRKVAVLLPLGESCGVRRVLEGVEEIGQAQKKEEEAERRGGREERKVYKVYDWRERGRAKYSRWWWMQVGLMKGCRVVAAGRGVVLVEYDYVEASKEVTVAHVVAVLKHLQQLHSGGVKEEMEAVQKVAHELGDDEACSSLATLEEKKWAMTHNDVRLSNMVFTVTPEESRLIDFDMAGRQRYPPRYNHEINDGRRHASARAEEATAVEHDLYAMAKALELYKCDDDSARWQEALALLLTGAGEAGHGQAGGAPVAEGGAGRKRSAAAVGPAKVAKATETAVLWSAKPADDALETTPVQVMDLPRPELPGTALRLERRSSAVEMDPLASAITALEAMGPLGLKLKPNAP